MKEYNATIKVIRFYEIDFEDEVFDQNCIKEEIKIVGLKHDGFEIKRDAK